ncbi:MAG: DUF6391 domain-containing protein [Humidesulfovibrio sp.]|jgi:hypothetical protein|uniref:DUF6391 domain-containing protein n=1 Tax=Humidesulfovibrio sp. TaxID=2910988 RepID=UPI002736BB94|nr:DUF6391 domain-containing protein [Humidesulfovibrio sp.]MDP2846790.1 DUF6391 domain-containing protein [Humidesulfovibrio sp.]
MQKAFLNFGIISLIRRNHGLEHATINLLSKKFPGSTFAGYSDHKGFWIVGDVSTDALLEIAQQALTRMKGGERKLAIHDNCGSNYVVAGLLAGSLAWLATLGSSNSFKKKLDRWPMLVLLVTGALIVAQPLGPKVQEHVTTSGEPGDLAVKQIVRYERDLPGRPALHRILTAEVIRTLEEAA